MQSGPSRLIRVLVEFSRFAVLSIRGRGVPHRGRQGGTVEESKLRHRRQFRPQSAGTKFFIYLGADCAIETRPRVAEDRGKCWNTSSNRARGSTWSSDTVGTPHAHESGCDRNARSCRCDTCPLSSLDVEANDSLRRRHSWSYELSMSGNGGKWFVRQQKKKNQKTYIVPS